MKKFLIAATAGAMLLAGCSEGEEQTDVTEETEEVNEEQEIEETEAGEDFAEGEPVDSADYIEDGAPITANIEQEAGVLGAQVFVDGDTAVGSLMLDESVEEERVEALAQNFAEEIKAAHEDKAANVQVVQNNEIVADITIE
ncbi:hypothetical protein BpOF4_06695 [Alkalihalophilus pseudofirmus OF4]|uniref:Lipoprotein n=1 Tax=Alkalihalophilus pseudofirmus (strain ATCC BAA-2126 / JCM 17055 / OF4) TaxID=398511 RepID=D3G0C2_ALKPO|nr:hypothetical protein [Alkalihalophilus pseudofirmus]ADC49397.1 hypothetical protein BpOF4_06695 [Alkalihalophilus pseudofirmus OF4]